MSLVIPSYFAPSFGGQPPVIVQSEVNGGDTVSLSGITPGNLILAMGSGYGGLQTGNVSFSGFPATFSADGNSTPSGVVRAGYATGTTASFRYDRSPDINILVEISGADVSTMASAHDNGVSDPVDCPSLSGFVVGDLVIGFGNIRGDDSIGGASVPTGTTLIEQGGDVNGTSEGYARAVWKPAVVGSNSIPDLMNGGSTFEDWSAFTIRIPAA